MSGNITNCRPVTLNATCLPAVVCRHLSNVSAVEVGQQGSTVGLSPADDSRALQEVSREWMLTTAERSRRAAEKGC